MVRSPGDELCALTMTRRTVTPARCSSSARSCFFFQAEDGIRDLTVTRVQTCALPICRIVSRIVRSYDAHGRIIEEKQIEEDPALIFADKFAAEEGPEPAAAQLEAMNRAMKLMLSGRSDTRISYAYDAQGRITKTHSHNFAFDDVTAISYNEHGDTSAVHQTFTGNSTLQVGVPYSMDENGKLIPSDPAAKPTKLPDISGEVQYAYQYDSYGNWTEQTSSERSRPNEPSMVRHRTITYY